MIEETLIETNDVDEARYVMFEEDFNGIVTGGKLYKLYLDKPMGLDPSVRVEGYDWCLEAESYFVQDDGKRNHGRWAYFKSKLYK